MSPSLHKLTIAAWALAAVAGVDPIAHAAVPDEAPRSPRLPWSTAAEQDRGDSVFGHAAGLGLMEGSEFGVGFSSHALGPARADGLYGFAATRLGPVGMGLAYSHFVENDRLIEGTERLDLSAGYQIMPGFSAGFRYTGLFNDLPTGAGGEVGRYHSVALSTTWRPVRALSVAASIDRLNRPDVGAVKLDPVATLGLAIRPGSERVAFGLDGRAILRDAEGWSAGVSLRIMPVAGFEIGGHGRYSRMAGDPDFLEWGFYLRFGQGPWGVAAGIDRADPATSGGAASMLVSSQATWSSARQPSLVTPKHRVVKLTFGGTVPERRPVELLAPEIPPFGYWLVLLEVLAADPDVDAVLIDIVGAPAWGQCWELRQHLGRLKAAGKKVYAQLEWGDMRDMYLASIADRIYLHPAGGLMLTGLSVTRTYLKGLLDKIGVNAQFVKHEGYKSAPERFTQTGPSEKAQEQSKQLLYGFDRAWFDAMEKGRGLDRAALDKIIAEGPQTTTRAHELNLVDSVLYDDELEDALSEELGARVSIVEHYRPPPRTWRRWGGRQRVAVVPVVGSIIDGRARKFTLPYVGQTTGDLDFKDWLAAAVDAPDIVGIVVRVDSPGGSVVASDKMYRAVQKAAEKKPLVISFGDIAASGGYYLAMGGAPIIASPVTITGSIGIFTGKADLSGLYDKLGITSSTDKTHAHADQGGTHRPWTEAELKRARERLGAYYDRFVSLVAKGRGLSKEEARERARGRVYLGERALALRIVNREGTLLDAVTEIRKLAGLSDHVPLDLAYPGSRGLMAQVRSMFGGMLGFDDGPVAQLPDFLRPLAEALANLVAMNQGAVMARLPFHLEIR